MFFVAKRTIDAATRKIEEQAAVITMLRDAATRKIEEQATVIATQRTLLSTQLRTIMELRHQKWGAKPDRCPHCHYPIMPQNSERTK